jgi:hypothetical protein
MRVKDCPACNCENAFCPDKTEEFIKALTSVYLCCGYSPEHLGADNYKDPGIILAQEIINAMREAAGSVLKHWGYTP